MLTLPNSTLDKLQLVTAQNGAEVVVAYNDDDGTGSYSSGSQKTPIVGAATTDICDTPGVGSPLPSVTRDVNMLSVKNTYAGAHAVTVQQVSGGTAYGLVTVTLQQDDTLQYAHGQGWSVVKAASISVASGKIAAFLASLTLRGTDGTTMTFPSTSATIARTDAANTFTGHQTIEGVTSTGATGTGNLVFSASPTLTGTAVIAAQTNSGLITANAGISIPTGQSVTGAGTAQVVGFQVGSFGSAGNQGSVKILGSTSGTATLTTDATATTVTLDKAFNPTGDVYTAAWTNYAATSTIVGWAATPTAYIYYKKIGKTVFCKFSITGTSNSVNTSFTLPYTTSTDFTIRMSGGFCQDNSVTQTTPCCITIPSNSNAFVLYKDISTAAWTASGTKTVHGEFWFEASA